MDPSLRIIDANLNRAREAARVVEDYCRLAQNDAIAAATLKQIRHALGALEQQIGRAALLTARDTAGDVGTQITTVQESSRPTTGDVLAANLRRLEEALRSLEEWSKLAVGPEIAGQLEQARYRTYELEKQLANPARAILHQSRLMLIVTSELCRLPVAEVLAETYRAGVRLFQLREKAISDRELLSRLTPMVEQLRQLGSCCIIINDRVDLALALGADGVHLGQSDLPIAAARQIAGGRLMFGLSTRTRAEAEAALAARANWLGAGAIFPSSTKGNTILNGPAWGAEAAGLASSWGGGRPRPPSSGAELDADRPLDGGRPRPPSESDYPRHPTTNLRLPEDSEPAGPSRSELASEDEALRVQNGLEGRRSLPTPVFCIGGITPTNLPELRAAFAHQPALLRLAVSSAICNAEQPGKVAGEICTGLQK